MGLFLAQIGVFLAVFDDIFHFFRFLRSKIFCKNLENGQKRAKNTEKKSHIGG